MFDFAAFRAAVEARDVDRWLPFFADDAEWLEFRHKASSPRVMGGLGLTQPQSTTTRQPPSRIWSPLRTRRSRSTRRPPTQVPLLDPRSLT
jgi:hypothetical protein